MKLTPLLGVALASALTFSISAPAQALTSPPEATETATEPVTPETPATTLEAAPAPASAATPETETPINTTVNVELTWAAPFNNIGSTLPSVPFTNSLTTRFTSEHDSQASGTIRIYRTETVGTKTGTPTLVNTYTVKHTGTITETSTPVTATSVANFVEGKIAYHATYTPTDTATYAPTSITTTPPLTYNHKTYPTKLTAPQLDGKPATIQRGLSKNVLFKLEISPTEVDRNIILETSTDNGKTWKTATTETVPADPTTAGKAPTKTVTAWISHATPPGGLKYRVRVPASANQQATTTTGTLHVTDKTKQYMDTLPENTLLVPWRSNTLIINPTGYNGATIKVEELQGKTWKTIKTFKNNAKNSQIRYTLPKGTTNSNSATKQYRTTIVGNAEHITASRINKITWENPRKYTGDRLRVYNSFKDKCPTALVRSAKPMKGVWATAVGRTQIITVHGHIPNQHIRTVGLHECAHIKQYDAYKNKGGYKAMDKRLNQLFGTRGTLGSEQSADCIANVWKRNSYWAYKGSGKCNGARLASAKAIIAGKTY